MPGTTATPDIELIVEDIGGGGSGPPPPPGGGDDGDGGGEDRHRRNKPSPSPKRYSTAIAIGIVSILMFFMALASAFIVLRRGNDLWVSVHLPRILWANTLVLLASSFTLESARRRLFLADLSGFREFWLATTVLGFLFVAGQLVAWRQLVAQGVYIASNQSLLTIGISWMDSGFFCWRFFTLENKRAPAGFRRASLRNSCLQNEQIGIWRRTA